MWRNLPKTLRANSFITCGLITARFLSDSASSHSAARLCFSGTLPSTAYSRTFVSKKQFIPLLGIEFLSRWPILRHTGPARPAQEPPHGLALIGSGPAGPALRQNLGEIARQANPRLGGLDPRPTGQFLVQSHRDVLHHTIPV